MPNAGLRGRPRFPLGPLPAGASLSVEVLFRRNGGFYSVGTELGYLLLRVGNEALKKLQHCVAGDTVTSASHLPRCAKLGGQSDIL